MRLPYTPQKARHQAAFRVRSFHRDLVEAGLATPAGPPEPKPGLLARLFPGLLKAASRRAALPKSGGYGFKASDGAGVRALKKRG